MSRLGPVTALQTIFLYFVFGVNFTRFLKIIKMLNAFRAARESGWNQWRIHLLAILIQLFNKNVASVIIFVQKCKEQNK